MKRLPKASLAAFAACALVLAACGDDDDDAPSDDTTEEGDSETTDAPSDDTDAPSDDTDAPSDDTGDSGVGIDSEEEIRDFLLERTGLSEDQVDCLIDAVDPENVSVDNFDPTQFIDAFDDCDIELSDIQPGG